MHQTNYVFDFMVCLLVLALKHGSDVQKHKQKILSHKVSEVGRHQLAGICGKDFMRFSVARYVPSRFKAGNNSLKRKFEKFRFFVYENEQFETQLFGFHTNFQIYFRWQWRLSWWNDIQMWYNSISSRWSIIIEISFFFDLPSLEIVKKSWQSSWLAKWH